MRPLTVVVFCCFLHYARLLAAAETGRVVVTEAIQPHLAIDAVGTIYVAFIHKGNICVSRSTDRGRTFSPAVIAIDVQGRVHGGWQRGPRIAVDARKVITVTAPVVLDDSEYTQRYPRAELFIVQSKDGGKTWSQPVQVNEVAKQAPEALHWMAVAPSGEVHIAWCDIRSRNGPGMDIYYAKAINGKVSKNLKVATTVCECCAPGLAVDASGNPFIAYREGGGKPSREIYALRSSDKGASFGSPVRINQRDSMEKG